MTVDLRRTILDATDLTRQKVHVKEWGVDVWVRSITGTERDRMEAQWTRRRTASGRDDGDNTEFRAFAVCWCCVDEDGKPVFDTNSDVIAIGKKAMLPLVKLFTVADALNGFTSVQVEELAGNCEAGESAGSTSDSP